MRRYILNAQREPVPEPDFLAYAMWMNAAWEADPPLVVVAKTKIRRGLEVSTVFLGINHNWSDRGPPVLFETMVFRKGVGVECRRTSTWIEAAVEHERMVAFVKGSNVVRLPASTKKVVN